jgi:HEAT repeat protein
MKLQANLLILGLLCISSFNNRVDAQESASTFSFDGILASSHTNDVYSFKKVSDQFDVERKRVGVELLKVLTDSDSSNFHSNLNQCVAAYYLGEIRCVDSARILADHITLQLDVSRIQIIGLINLEKLKSPALDALIKIGTPAIPALVQHLQESDDVKVREFLLKALYQIEGDRDIVQLRLEKALKAEKDSQKQARLQLALKALAQMKDDK